MITPDFTMVAGDTKTLRFTITDVLTAGPLNLANASIRFGIAELNHDGSWGQTALITKATPGGITIVNAAAGVCELTLAPADTAVTPRMAGRYYYQLEVSIGGVVSTVREGVIEIRPDLFPPG